MKNQTYHLALGAALALTLNRATDAAGAPSDKFTLPADGWFQIGAPGEMSKELEMPGGKKVRIRQVVTADDLAKIANRVQTWAAEPGFDGLLVDFDHESADRNKSTRAAAWVLNAERRADGKLWGQLRLSAAGRAALEGGDFRHFSPVLGFEPRDYAEGEEAHPVALLGGAFTNQPTFRGMLPLSNRADALGAPLSPVTTTTMKKELVIALLAALGHSVAADASPEVIDAAVIEATSKAGTKAADMAATTNRLKKLEEEQIERDLDAHGLKGQAREQAKGFLTKNREEGLAFIAALSGGDVNYARTHNREQAKPPLGEAKSAEEATAQFEAKVTDYKTRNRCTYQQAHDAVRGAEPALYARSIG
jgi:hypothetical protein